LVDGALWLALNIGISMEARQTLTRGCPVSVITNCIDATRRRITWIDNLRPISVILLRVASMQFVITETGQPLVSVCLASMEIPMLSASQSAPSTKSVPPTLHA
jgi:hypothetical protein